VPHIVSAPRALRHLLVAATGLIVILGSSLALIAIAQGGRILPGTTVVGVDVGGRDPWSAQRILTPALEREQRRPVAVSAPGQRLLVRPMDAGVRFDVTATTAAALAHGRGGPGAALPRLLAGMVHRPIAARADVDEAALVAWLDHAAERVERTASVGDLRVDRDTGAINVHGPHGAIVVDREASLAALRSALTDPDVSHVALVTRATTPPSRWSDIEHLAERVEVALRAPIRLEHEGRRLLVAPDVLAELLSVASIPTATGIAPGLAIPAHRVQRLLGEEGRAVFNSPAEDAEIVTPKVPSVALTDLSSTSFEPVPATVEIIPGQSQTTFIARPIAEQLVRMVMEGIRQADADLIVVPPSLTTVDAELGRPTHLLGTFTTFHPSGVPRTANIRLLADLLDDQLIAPGEEFSVNGTSGPRRCEDGFVPAGTIIRGELVDTCGGGVSQFGTTLMNAMFFAGLPMEQWQPHSFFISRYPAGREATLSYPDLDVRFRNDTEGWIVLRTSHTPDSITVALYGIPRWQEVRATHGERRAPTDFEEVLRPTTDLRPGVRRVIQSGGGGFTVTVTRMRVPIGDATEPAVERWTTVYRPQQRIVEVGVQPAGINPGDGPVVAGPPAAGGAASGG